MIKNGCFIVHVLHYKKKENMYTCIVKYSTSPYEFKMINFRICLLAAPTKFSGIRINWDNKLHVHVIWWLSVLPSMNRGFTMSWFINSKFSWPIQCSTLRFRPVKKLSTTVTSWPSSIRRSTRWDPTKPAPPDICTGN